MKNRLTLILFSLVLLSNCTTKEQGNSSSQNTKAKVEDVEIEYKAGDIISSISCSKNSLIEYALYLPKSYDKQKKHPIIFFFDAHAEGKKPLKLYSQLADKYEFIFAGSNNSKNGLDNQTLGEIITTTMNDVLEKFSVDANQIYTSGFSGGAKVAAIAAFGSPQIKGVIACAAAMPVELLSKTLTYNYIGIAGLEDFNYIEMAKQDELLKNVKHDLIVYDGKHEWAPANIMDRAIRTLIVNSMEEGRRTKEENFITTTNKLLKDSIVHYNYPTKLQEQEERLQQHYLRALGEKDKSWWINETKNLNKNTEGKNETSYMYKRILNYLSMACYTYVSKAFYQNQMEATDHYLSVYEMVDPDNVDAFYFRAIFYARQNKNQEALEMLKKSAELGLGDVEKMRSEPAFSSIRNAEGFEEIVAKVAENSAN